MKSYYIIYTTIAGKATHTQVQAENEKQAREKFWKQFPHMGCQIKFVGQI